MSSSLEVIRSAFDAHISLSAVVRDTQAQAIDDMAQKLVACVKQGGKILWCGNGGSAADSQHLAAELIGRFKKEREPIASIALTTDSSILTCVGNDYGYDQVFSRQVRGLMSNKDALIAISTSGNSENVIQAVRAAKKIGGFTIGLLGKDGGKLKAECDLVFIVPSTETAHIQEMHILVGHLLCGLLDYHLV